MRRVFVFPGQGSQSVGMLAELAAQQPIVVDTFAEASAELGYDLWQVVQQGPAERLAETVTQQPAMLTAGVATWRYWQAVGGFAPDVVCGHSLGEFTALTVAGVLDLPTAVGLVKRRAELMQEAVPAGVGAIAAVLGLDDEAIAAACGEAAQGEVVQRALDLCKAAGAKRALILPMSVPAHSALMRPAAERFGAVLAAVPMQQPALAFWSPVDGAAHFTIEEIRRLLTRQLASPVRWTSLIRSLAASGATTFIECGPGKVLTGLNRRIEKRPEVQCLALQDPAAVQAALAV
jgi:[acyl-carrier-protein] S-malonyltransferase